MTIRFDNNIVSAIDVKETFGDLIFRSSEVVMERGENNAVTDDSKEIRVLFYSEAKKDLVYIVFPRELEEKIATLKRKEMVELVGTTTALGWVQSRNVSDFQVVTETGFKITAEDFKTTSRKPQKPTPTPAAETN